MKMFDFLFLKVSHFLLNILACNWGKYWDSEAGHCRTCPIATYSDTINATSCTPCPNGETTAQEGSIRRSKCKTRMQLCFLFLSVFMCWRF